MRDAATLRPADGRQKAPKLAKLGGLPSIGAVGPDGVRGDLGVEKANSRHVMKQGRVAALFRHYRN
jgi:hypothetical protein